MKIKVIIKRPGEKPHSTWISDTLENLQKTVEGYIETVTFAGVVVICNEEGRIKGLPYNCTVGSISFVGTVIFAGVRDDAFADIPCTFGTFKRLFPQLFEEVKQ